MTDFKKDDDVRVVGGVDEYFDERFKGKKGKVAGIHKGTKGIGLIVKFPDGSRGAFLDKELELIK